MRIWVPGAGAIGGNVAMWLTTGGNDVSVVAHGRYRGAIREANGARAAVLPERVKFCGPSLCFQGLSRDANGESFSNLRSGLDLASRATS